MSQDIADARHIARFRPDEGSEGRSCAANLARDNVNWSCAIYRDPVRAVDAGLRRGRWTDECGGADTMANGESPQTAPLSKQQILRVALDIVDEQGLAALSIRRVADALGVYPTAVSWHVGNKTGLLESTAALLFDDLELPDDPDMDWTGWLKETAHRWRAQMRRHPSLAPIIGNHLTVSPPALPFVERVLRVMVDAGLRDDDLLRSYNAYVGCLVGWTSLELSQSVRSPEEAKERFNQEIADLNRNLFPALLGNLEVVSNRAFMLRWSSATENPLDDSFDSMMAAVIEGISRRSPREGSR